MAAMSAQASVQVKDDEVYAATVKGTAELKSTGTALSVTELQVLILVDGFSPVAQIASFVPNIPRDQVNLALRKLLAGKLIGTTSGPDAEGLGSGFSTIAVPVGFFSGLTLDAKAEANGGAAILKKKGYYVRIARRPAGQREIKEGWNPTILVLDDDTDLQKLIRTFFMMEGFMPRAAHKAAEFVPALRLQPPPDLILLDVQLPDANGFDILAKMRQHPVLKNMPVVMFTAESSRAAVLKGLQLGADGYVTKPFEPDVLVAAVKAVLGLSAPPEPAEKAAGKPAGKPAGVPPGKPLAKPAIKPVTKPA